MSFPKLFTRILTTACLMLLLPIYAYSQGATSPVQPAPSIDAISKSLSDLSDRYDKLAELVSQLSQTRPPIGSIVAFAGPATQVPSDWRICDGSVVSATNFPKLFQAIGLAWGGTDSTAFKLPNLQGMFLRGIDNGAGPDPDKNRKLASVQHYATALPSISFVTDNPGDHTHPLNVETTASRNPNGGQNNTLAAPAKGAGRDTAGAGNHTHKIVSGGDSETRPTNVAILWIIKVS